MKLKYFSCLNKLSNKFKLDHPIFIVILGHLTIFLLALPYYYRFKLYSLLKIFLIIFLYILFFSLPFIVDNFLKYFKWKKNSKLYILLKKVFYTIFFNPKLYGFLLFVSITYGVYVVNKSIILGFIYSFIVLFMLNIYSKNFNKCMVSNNKNKNSAKRNNSIFKIFLMISNKINEIMFIIGLLSFILIVAKYGGIPLFNYDIRMTISSDPLRLISTGALVYVGLNSFKYFLISFLFIILLGYKAGVLILCASYLIYLYRKKKISTKHLIFSSIILLIILSIMAKIILMFSNQNWKINTLKILSYRAYFDMLVLNKIINYPNMTLGKIVFNPIGERYLGELLFGYPHNMTATLFGPIIMDFKYYGLIFATILGVGCKIIYESGNDKIYSIYAAILLTMCEIGINYGFIIVFLVFLYSISLIRVTKK